MVTMVVINMQSNVDTLCSQPVHGDDGRDQHAEQCRHTVFPASAW
jgi:hypothetical protein